MGVKMVGKLVEKLKEHRHLERLSVLRSKVTKLKIAKPVHAFIDLCQHALDGLLAGRVGLESCNREIHVMPLSAKGVGESSGFDQLEKLSVLCTQGLHLFSTGREGSETCMAFSKTQAAPAPKRCDSDCSPGALTPTG